MDNEIVGLGEIRREKSQPTNRKAVTRKGRFGSRRVPGKVDEVIHAQNRNLGKGRVAVVRTEQPVVPVKPLTLAQRRCGNGCQGSEKGPPVRAAW